jgi:hypothetical protein
LKRFIVIGLIVCGLVGMDIGLSILAAKAGVGSKAEWHSFRISFWSGLAYSAWIATIFSVVAGTVIWLVEDTVRRRWQSAREVDQMMRDAILAINALYAEFPKKPIIHLSESDSDEADGPIKLSDQDVLRPALYTNRPEEAKRWQDEYEQAVTRITTPALGDKAVNCIPPVAARIYSRFNKVSSRIWREGSPLVTDDVLNQWISAFLRSYRNLLAAAEHLDYLLRYHVRWQNMTTAEDTYEDEADRCFYLGTILGYHRDFLLDALAPADEKRQARLIEHHARLRAVANLERLVEPYTNAMTAIRTLLFAIQNHPRTAPVHYRGFYITDPPWGFDDRFQPEHDSS